MDNLKKCKQGGCEISNGGSCLEGLDIDECPHFYWAEEDSEDSSEDSSESEQNQDKIKLFSGTELTLKEISVVTQKYPCDLIVILGDLGCGKTTLLATIYDIFQTSGFNKYLYAGSLTQRGFEVRCHLSRMTSGASQAHTERTKFNEFRILHLALYCIETEIEKHFLLTDISGETIRQAVYSAATIKEQLSIVKDADHLIYVIDGEKLATAKAATFFSTEMFFANAVSNKLFTTETILCIIISKYDRLSSAGQSDLQNEVRDRLNEKFSKDLKEIRYKIIASRPAETDESFPLGFGVEDLLDEFVKPHTKGSFYEIEKSNLNRYMDLFKVQEHE